jgi:hypothetical protein
MPVRTGRSGKRPFGRSDRPSRIAVFPDAGCGSGETVSLPLQPRAAKGSKLRLSDRRGAGGIISPSGHTSALVDDRGVLSTSVEDFSDRTTLLSLDAPSHALLSRNRSSRIRRTPPDGMKTDRRILRAGEAERLGLVGRRLPAAILVHRSASRSPVFAGPSRLRDCIANEASIDLNPPRTATDPGEPNRRAASCPSSRMQAAAGPG